MAEPRRTQQPQVTLAWRAILRRLDPRRPVSLRDGRLVRALARHGFIAAAPGPTLPGQRLCVRTPAGARAMAEG